MDVTKEIIFLGLMLLSICVIVESMGLCLFARRFPNQTKTELIQNYTIKEDKAITCSTNNLPAVTNGFFDCTPNSGILSEGEGCALRCNNGFYPASSNQTVCKQELTYQGGQWSNGSYVCHEITCLEGDLPLPLNGQLTCISASIREGDVCNLTCNDGYYPFPSNSAVCGFRNSGNGGEWIPAVSCRQIVCNDWNEWKGREYKFFNTRQTWQQSRQLCENNDSHLVTIENEEENEFIHKMEVHCSSQVTRIGISDIDIEGTWRWSDGEEVTYTNWREGEPNGGENENCVYVISENGKWNDVPCDTLFHTVCEREK